MAHMGLIRVADVLVITQTP